MQCIGIIKLLNLEEDILSDRYFDIFDPMDSVSDLSILKTKFFLEEFRVQRDDFNLVESGLV